MVPMWRATGEKRAAIAPVIGFGGAVFGGKSYGKLLLAQVAAQLWAGVQIAYFRRTYPELDGPGAAIQKAHEVISAKATDGGKEWNYANGSTLYFRHCQNEKDVYAYQSQQIDILLVDEATHFTWFIIDYLMTRNRASGNVKEPGFKPFAVLSSNPGNIGHAAYSQLFDVTGHEAQPSRPHETVKEVVNPNGNKSRIYFIPAFLEDNAIGNAADPEYESRLSERAAEIAKALRKGDWKVFAGQRFPTWVKDRIACTPFEIPRHWAKWRAADYGYKHPMTAGWFTRNPETGRVYIYRAVIVTEVYDAAQAEMIRDMTPPDELITTTFASPDMWAHTAKKNASIQTSADEYKAHGVPLTRADDDRVNGVRKIDRLLGQEWSDGKPMIQVFEPYYEVFKIMETLVHDDAMRGKDAEDVKKIEGDDPYDMLRYGFTNLKQPENKPQEGTDRRPGKGNRAL